MPTFKLRQHKLSTIPTKLSSFYRKQNNLEIKKERNIAAKLSSNNRRLTNEVALKTLA